MVLGLRQAGVPFFRACSAGNGEQSKWQCFAAWVGTVFDVFMVLSIPATPVVYALGGREKAVSICSAFGAYAGIGNLYRLWKNVGSLWGGVGFFSLAMVGVLMTAVYKSTGIEFLHLFIGGSFIMSVVPFTLAMKFSTMPVDSEKMVEDRL
mmetsp:Transcript_10880/g.22063  ORF Transcript_10880/g.22063 Transcript_10880/m.22063 type:complete len:151 (-) Transcript_10880:55-507(-)